MASLGLRPIHLLRLGNDTSHEILADNYWDPRKPFYGFLGEEEQRRKRAFGFTRIRVIRSLRRRHRGENFVQPNSKKWLCHFFDRLRQKGKPRRASPFDCFVRRKEWKIESQRLLARRPVRAAAGQLVNFLTFCWNQLYHQIRKNTIPKFIICCISKKL